MYQIDVCVCVHSQIHTLGSLKVERHETEDQIDTNKHIKFIMAQIKTTHVWKISMHAYIHI